jgi:predicted dithiol-disulfide oxidoreductase (DUF899 family)
VRSGDNQQAPGVAVTPCRAREPLVASQRAAAGPAQTWSAALWADRFFSSLRNKVAKLLSFSTGLVRRLFGSKEQTKEEQMQSAKSRKGETPMSHPRIVSREEWQRARDQLLIKEKAATHARDALAAERRRLPMVRIEKNYLFEGPNGKVSLRDLFEGYRQLIIYHFMFAPDVDGWPSAGCPGCSMVVDHIGPLAHLHARDTTLALVSRAPLANLESYKRRMGWAIPWFSSAGTEFNEDFGVTTAEGENFGLSAFLREGDDVFHTYFTNSRGVEVLDSNFTLLDITPLGRQEEWEDSPAGWPQTPPYEWWRRHDEY